MTDKKHELARRRDSIDLSSYSFGKIQPQAREMEEAVLGAMLLERSAIPIAIGILKSEMFYVSAHNLIYSAMVELFGKSEPVDILTVTDQLRTNQSLETAGGPFYVSELANRIASGAHIEKHATVIKQKWIQRERIRISSEAISCAYEDVTDPLDDLGNDIAKYHSVMNEVSSGQVASFRSTVDEVFSNIAVGLSRTQEEKELVGYSSGVTAIDRISGGFRKERLTVIAGRPGDGKTSLAINSLLHNAKKGIPVGLFSLEMSRHEIVQALLALESGIDVNNIATTDLSDEQQYSLSAIRQMVESLPIWIYDKGGLTLAEASAVAKGWQAKYGVELFIFDYLQLMKVGGNHRLTREQEVSEISRGCKQLSKDLHQPVVGISALSRKLEDRSGWDKRPREADLRESGSIEFDADTILFVFRPENHGLAAFSDDYFNDNGNTKNVIEYNISKNKLGKRGKVRQVVTNGTGRLNNYNALAMEVDKKAQAQQGSLYDNPYQNQDDESIPF